MVSQHQKNRIKIICECYRIVNYIINDDGSIDVDGNVFLSSYNLKDLPLNFNRISGSFSCASNYLSSLKGCPKEVGGDFHASNNKLTSLEYFPIRVDGKVNYTDNPYLPSRLQNVICTLSKDDLLILFKYYIHYDVYENGILNENNYDLLIQDIKEGLR